MNELRRMAYLDAMGVDSYVSRAQLPGAAATRRLAIVQRAAPDIARSDSAVTSQPGGPPARGEMSMPRIEVNADTAQPVASSPKQRQRRSRQQDSEVPRFSLAAIVAGGWLWLEELAGMPLSSEQVWLVQSMARALDVKAGACGQQPPDAKPHVSQFDWPIHTNAQLDIGEEAARASVAGFVGRKVEQHRCRGVVLMGATCEKWVPAARLGVATATIDSTADVLSAPALKREVWRNLLALVGQ